MPQYRIHRIKEGPRESFRWAAHTGGLALVKPKDYICAEYVQADNLYDTWKRMSANEQRLHPGDLLELVQENSDISLRNGMWIAKYIGFEPAQWFVPEPSAYEINGAERNAPGSVGEPEGCPS